MSEKMTNEDRLDTIAAHAARITALLGELEPSKPEPEPVKETTFQGMVRECIQSKYMGCGVMNMPWARLIILYYGEVTRLTKLFNATLELAKGIVGTSYTSGGIKAEIEALKEPLP